MLQRETDNNKVGIMVEQFKVLFITVTRVNFTTTLENCLATLTKIVHTHTLTIQAQTSCA